MASERDETPQRWTAKRRAALVLSLLTGETSAAEAAREHGLTVGQVEEWREVFLLGAENALRSRPATTRPSRTSRSSGRRRRAASWCSTWTSCRRRRRAALSPGRHPTSEGAPPAGLRAPRRPGPRRRPLRAARAAAPARARPGAGRGGGAAAGRADPAPPDRRR